MGKKQHYLSQFYLKGFSRNFILSSKKRSKHYKVWIYNKSRKEILEKKVENTGFRFHYFSWKGEDGKYINEIDDVIQLLEDKIAQIIKIIDGNVKLIQSTSIIKRKQVNVKSLSKIQRESLIQYVLLLMNMNPKLMDSMTQKINNLDTAFLGKQSDIFRSSYQKKSILETLINIGTSEEVNFFNILNSRKIFIGFYTNNSTSFITTDNPIVTFRKDGASGIKYTDTEIYLPLTQRCILMLVDNDDGFENYFPIYDKNIITKHNKYISSFYYNLIIGRDKQLVESMVNSVIKK